MGNFLSFFDLGILLLIHELGHFLTAGVLGCPLYQICFYPFGGISKFQINMNQLLKEEWFILLMGPSFQILCYLVIKQIPMTMDHQILLKQIHYSLLFFNLLPIYPLDGGRMFLLILESFLPLYTSLQIIFFLSFIFNFFFFISFLFTKQLNFLFLFLLLLYTLFKEKQKFPYYYEKFLLERYLGKYKFRKGKIVNSMRQFYRNRRHLIYQEGKYYDEFEILKQKFTPKNL